MTPAFSPAVVDTPVSHPLTVGETYDGDVVQVGEYAVGASSNVFESAQADIL